MMKSLLVLALLFAVAYSKKSYEGYQVFSITPDSRSQFQQMMDLNSEFYDELDYWNTVPAGKASQVMVPPQHVDKFKEVLEDLQLEFEVINPNVQRVIDEEARLMAGRPRATTLANFNYNVYHSYNEISDWVTNFRKEESTPSLVITEINVATSYEGRKIKALKMSTGSGRKGAYTQGGIHAREWVSPATVINMVKKFVDDFKANDAVVVNFFSKYDWYVIPVLNADGYVYSHTSDRMWRKNRQANSGSWCYGIDMNRNYGYKWGGSGTSSNPCSEVYAGKSAYDATELNQVKNWLLGLKNGGQKFNIHVDVHSYSQYWVYPYSYTYSAYDKVPDHDKLRAVAIASTNALRSVHGTKYTYMTSGDWYPAAGSSEDFGYVTLDAKYSYTVEMRDTGYYGFQLPENQIQGTGEETHVGFKELFRQVLLDGSI